MESWADTVVSVPKVIVVEIAVRVNIVNIIIVTSRAGPQYEY